MKKLVVGLFAAILFISLFYSLMEMEEPVAPEFMNQDGIPLCEMTEQQAVEWMQEYISFVSYGEDNVSIEEKEYASGDIAYCIKLGEDLTDVELYLNTSDSGKVESVSVISMDVVSEMNAFSMGCAIAIALTDHYQEFDIESAHDYFTELLESGKDGTSVSKARGDIQYDVQLIGSLVRMNISHNTPNSEPKQESEPEQVEEPSSSEQYDPAPTNSARHDETTSYVIAQDIVESYLKAPSTAKFCSESECVIHHLGNGEYQVLGWVEAQNSYGAMLRQEFIVTYTATEKGYTNGYCVM